MSTVELAELVPYLGGEGVRVESVVSEQSWALVRASAQGEPSPCPACGSVASRVHSSYRRRLQDMAIGGRATTIELTVRRFFCDNARCKRTTFVEQVAGLTRRYARHSLPTRILALAVAFALGGRAGQRLLDVLAMPCGRMSLLRAIRATPEAAPQTPRVLGIDDFAIRRGHVYATILIDITTGRPVDVLPDRTKETVSAWLQAHPGVQIVCRDRSGTYAEAVREGAPDAIQVADRWHLWHNLGEAVEKVVIANRADLAEPLADTNDSEDRVPEPDSVATTVERPETGLAIRTRKRYAAVQNLVRPGVSRAAISRQLHLDPQTVRRFARASTVDELLVNTRRDSLIDPYRHYLHQRWNEGCTDATILHTEIRVQGFTGSDKTVRRYLRPFRATVTAPPVGPQPPKARQVARWIMTDPDNLDSDNADQLRAIIARSPKIAALAEHVRNFATMMRKRTGTRDLPRWIEKVNADDLPALHTLTNGIRTDLAAVTNGLSLPYSSGPVEGHVNRIKTIKRQMYGRANFDLLRRRILAPI
jgi:transposase